MMKHLHVSHSLLKRQFFLFPACVMFYLLCLSVFIGKDLFGAEPFDPFTCGAADFPPDIQSKLDEMQVSSRVF